MTNKTNQAPHSLGIHVTNENPHASTQSAPVVEHVDFNSFTSFYAPEVGFLVVKEDLSCSLPNLKELNFTLTTFPELKTSQLGNLNNLTVLILSEDRISKMQPRAFSNLSVLECLDLASNSSEAIGVDDFAGLINLKLLDLTEQKNINS